MTSGSIKDTHKSISFNGGSDLLRSRGDRELSFTLEAFIQSLLGHRGSAAHVLIAGVGAAANQAWREEPAGVHHCGTQEEDLPHMSLTNFHLKGPTALLSSNTYVRHGVSQVRGEGSIDVRLQLFQKKAIFRWSSRTSPPN